MTASGELLIVGPGAVGRVLAARWVEAGREVAILGRTAASESALARRGFRFTGTAGRARRIRRGLQAARARPPRPAEAIFVCVKSRDVAVAARRAKAWAGPKTAVVCLQNGVGHVAAARRVFGRRTVIGVCYVAAERTGTQVSHNGGRVIHLARRPDNAPFAARAAFWLRAAGWKVSVESDEDSMLWTKLCFNAAGNPLGAACRASNGELVRDPTLRRLLLAAMDEVVAAATRDGHRVASPSMRRMILKTYPLDSRQRNSMLQDLEAGRQTEIDAIAGPALAAGRRRGLAMPVLTKLSFLVKRLSSLVKPLERP